MSVGARTFGDDFFGEHRSLCVVPGLAVAVHRIEVELLGVDGEVVVDVFRVGEGLQQRAAVFEGEFYAATVTHPSPGFGLLGGELHGHSVLRGSPADGIGSPECGPGVGQDDDRQRPGPSDGRVDLPVLASIYRAAIDDRIVTTTPCRGIKLPRLEQHQVTPPDTDQVRALVEAIPERYRAVVVLGAGTGLRQGEAFGVAVDRVNFLRRTLVVDQQLVLPPWRLRKLKPRIARCRCPTWSWGHCRIIWPSSARVQTV